MPVVATLSRQHSLFTSLCQRCDLVPLPITNRGPRFKYCDDCHQEVARERDRKRYREPGRNAECKERARQWDLDHPLLVIARRRSHYEQNKEEIRQSQKRRYTNNKPAYSARARRWRERNQEKIKTGRRSYKSTNTAAIKARAKRYYEKNKAALSQRQKEYREKNLARIKAQKRLARLLNPERHRELDRERYVRDKDKRLAAVKAYHKANPEVSRLVEARRRAWKKGASGRLTKKEWLDLCAKYDYRCLCCGETLPLSVDHVVPLSKGGQHVLSNIQPLCIDCNRKKSTRSTDYRI